MIWEGTERVREKERESERIRVNREEKREDLD